MPTAVVAPAAIRDAGVWQDEAKRIGWDAPLRVISYHQLAKGKDTLDPLQYKALIFDEAHWLKNRKVSWGEHAVAAARMVDRVYLSSGTPTPNDASELWGQLRVIRPDLVHFWPWADGNTKEGATGWFHISKDRYSDYVIGGVLEDCVQAGCHNARKVTNRDCEHWARFRRLEQEPWMMGRPEDLLDLPPMSGYDVPLWTPMKAAQARAYAALKKDFLAEMPAEGISLEALSDTQKFVQLWMLSTGVGSVDADQDHDLKHSGKMALIGEMLDDRDSPTLVGTYFRNTAAQMVRLCKRLGKSYTLFGAATTPTARRKAVTDFQSGKIDVMIGSIPVIGEGLTLTAADGVFLAERMWTPDKNAQVVRRSRRRGQDKPVGVRQFVTPKTVDSGQWEALREKRDRISRVDVVRMLEGEYAEL